MPECRSFIRGAPTGGGWLSFTIWVMLGMALVAFELYAWLRSEHLHQVQWYISSAWYGIPYERAPWFLKVDGHLHIATMLMLVLWLVWGRRLWNLRISWWWPLLLALGVGITDEMIQSLSSVRAFEWDDLAYDLLGILVAGAIEGAIHRQHRLRFQGQRN